MVAKMVTKKEMEELEHRLNKKLEEVLSKLTLVEELPAQIAELKAMLETSRKEAADLRKTLQNKDSEIASLKLHCNNLEQYNRSWSVRIHGMAVSSEVEKSSKLMKEKVYNSLLLPILSGAVASGDLESIPSVNAVIETAHVLPAKAGKVKPIIVRFITREIKATIFKNKKEFAPRETGRSGPQGRTSRYLFPFFDDLTGTNFNKMRALAADPRVATCWAAGGSIKYKLKDSEVVKRVASVFDTVDVILA
jgi:hypothetical protein